MKHQVIVGRVEVVDFPEQGVSGVPAKVDTGAFRSSISSSDVYEKDGVLHFKLFAKGMPWHTGDELTTQEYAKIEVENSFGHREERYSIYLKVRVAKRVVRANFTLANRTQKTYPILLGRRLLKNKFLVDVAKGAPIEDEETGSSGGLL
jgi:hypothetical protein